MVLGRSQPNLTIENLSPNQWRNIIILSSFKKQLSWRMGYGVFLQFGKITTNLIYCSPASIFDSKNGWGVWKFTQSYFFYEYFHQTQYFNTQTNTPCYWLSPNRYRLYNVNTAFLLLLFLGKYVYLRKSARRLKCAKSCCVSLPALKQTAKRYSNPSNWWAFYFYQFILHP